MNVLDHGDSLEFNHSVIQVFPAAVIELLVSHELLHCAVLRVVATAAVNLGVEK